MVPKKDVIILLPFLGLQSNQISKRQKFCIYQFFSCFNRPFPSSSGPLFQNEGRCSAFDMEIIFYSHAKKLLFTRKVLHLASFWKWGFLELRSGLYLKIIFQNTCRIKSFFPYKDRLNRSQRSKVIYKVGINRRDEAHWYMIPPVTFSNYYNELLFLFLFFQPLKKVCLQTEILCNLFKYILFCFIVLFTSSSPCRKDQFDVLYFSFTKLVVGIVMIFTLVKLSEGSMIGRLNTSSP